ncbi:MAG: hypothetical protein MI785_19710 [Kiloniellales bacterium]|nr:hypothetical protein [Kiloniellales bacterium]
MQNAKIRIWRMVGESYGFLLTHPGTLLRVGWLPLLLLFGLNLLFGGFDPWPRGQGLAALLPSLGLMTANVLAQSLVAAAVLVAWHRVVLLGEAAVPGLLGLHIGLREAKYLGSWLLLSLLFILVMVLSCLLIVALGFGMMLGAETALITAGSAGSIPLGEKAQFIVLQVLSLVGALLIATYATTRLSLILPALATDRRRSLGGAWELSAGSGWRLVTASLLVMLPMQAGYLGAVQAANSFGESPLYWPLALLASGFTLLLIVVTGTVLSLFSKALEQESAADPKPVKDVALAG